MRRYPILLTLIATISLGVAKAAETHTLNILSYDSAAKALEGSIAEAKKQKRPVAIVVLDGNGAVIASARMNGAKPVAYELALKKAKTALLFRGSSRTAMEEINKGSVSLLSLDDLAALPGGLAARKNGDFIGAIGVSGAPADIDETIAQAGMTMIDR